MNREVFYDSVRSRLFSGSLDDGQVDGMEGILDAWGSHGDGDHRKLAYILATAHHETGRRMSPVREGFATTDAGARRAVAGLYRKGRISRNYAAQDAKTGQSYYGRGQVQLTHKANYAKMGRVVGLDLVNQPDLALDPNIGARILVQGMMLGSFTNKKLADYINASRTDYDGARRIVNGTDKAFLIAGYARKYEAAIEAAEAAFVVPAPLPRPDLDDVPATLPSEPIDLPGAVIVPKKPWWTSVETWSGIITAILIVLAGAGVELEVDAGALASKAVEVSPAIVALGAVAVQLIRRLSRGDLTAKKG